MDASISRLFEVEGGAISSSSSIEGPGQLNTGGNRGHQSAPLLELPVHAPDDSKLTKDLPEDLRKVCKIVGSNRYNTAIRCLSRSAEQASSSTIAAAEALSLISIPKTEIRSREDEALLKDAKRTLRDVILWRCFSCSLGLDSFEAVKRTFEHCSHHARCEKDIVSQLTNGFGKLKLNMLGFDQVPASKPSDKQVLQTATSSATAEAQESTTTPTHKVFKPPPGLPVPGLEQRSAKSSVHPGPIAKPEPCLLVPGFQQKHVSANSPVNPSKQFLDLRPLIPPGPMAKPEPSLCAPGFQPEQVLLAKSSIKASRPSLEYNYRPSIQAPHLRTPGLPPLSESASSSSLACTASVQPGLIARPEPLLVSGIRQQSSASSVRNSRTPSDNTLPVRVLKRQASIILEELGKSPSSDSVDLAVWLGKAIAAYRQDFEKDLLHSVKGALLRTLQHVSTDALKVQLVLEALVLMTEFDFLSCPFLEMALVDSDDGLDEKLLHAVTEAWASWLLLAFEEKQSFQLKLNFQEVENILELTLALPDYFVTFLLKKEVARCCCQALGSLIFISKDSLELVKRIGRWIVETINAFIKHPDVVHQGLSSLVGIFNVCSQVLGVNVSDIRQADSHDSLATHLRQQLMVVAVTCDAQTDLFSDKTVMLAYQLVAFTHPFVEVLRTILNSKQRPQRELLSAVLDDINSSLTPAMIDWKQVALSQSSKPKPCPGLEAASCLSPNILLSVKAAGGVGIDALQLLEKQLQQPTLGQGANSTTQPRPRLPFLFEWARTCSTRYHQERFFLLGILFSPSLLIDRLAPISSDHVFFSNVARALLDLNLLEGFDLPLQRKLAVTLVDLEVPRTPLSCVAWVETLQICSVISEDFDLADMAADKLISASGWAAGNCGWAGFLYQALVFLTRLQQTGLIPDKNASLESLASLAQGKYDTEIQVHMQAQVLLSQLHRSMK